MFVPPPFTWTGFYVGVNAGGIWSSGSRTRRSLTRGVARGSRTISRAELGNNQSGFIGGGQAGYNWQSGAFVFGVETDFDGTSLGKTFNYASAPFGSVVDGVPSRQPLWATVCMCTPRRTWIGSERPARASASSQRRTTA